MMKNLRSTLALLPLTLAACAAPDPEVGARSAPLVVASPATPLPVVLPETDDPLLAGVVVPADAPEKGMWSASQPWPLNGLHSLLLPTGKVLTYGTPSGAPAVQDGRFFDVWDPALGMGALSHRTSTVPNAVNSFCGSAAFLPDGKLLLPGGNGASVESSELAPGTGAVATSAFRLADERWYATMIALADGRPIILGGSAPYAALDGYADPVAAVNGGTVSMTPEIFDPATGWHSLFGAYSREAFGPDYNRYWYPRAWVAPSGKIFGISTEKMWVLDPGAGGAVQVVGDFKTGVDPVTRPNVGPTSTAVMFAPGRILQAGGNGYRDGYASPGSALATVVDIRAGTPVVTETAPMHHARQWPNSTVLPDGRVVVTGGTAYGNNGGADAVYEAELWDPATGTWNVGASAAEVRVYHSAAILLPDGVVLSTGGGAPGPVNNLNAEIYYPPYLFRRAGATAELAPRPAIRALSGLELAYGTAVQVELAASDPVAKVVLVGTSSVTHSFNTSQRRLELEFVQEGARLAAALPASGADAPPGYYLLLVLDAAGVPSKGVIVGLGGAAAPPEEIKVPHGRQVRLASVNFPDHAISVAANGLGVLAALGEGSTPDDLLRAQYLLRDGLADPACVSFESVAQPGRFLRHYGFRLMIGTPDGGPVFANDATFCPQDGLAGTGVTFRSRNFPGNALRHRNFEVWADPVGNDAVFAADSSFTIVVTEPPALPPVAAPILPVGGTASYAPGVSAPGATYRWDFGDGSPATAFSASPLASHSFAAPGVYLVTFTVRMADGHTATRTFVQAVVAPATAQTPASSTPIAVEPRSGGATRVWTVNPDEDSVTVFDPASGARLAEVSVGRGPRTLALAPDGRMWVVNRDDATIAVVGATSLAVEATLPLPRASQPFGLVFAPDGQRAYVALEASGRVISIDAATGQPLAAVDVGLRPRHLSISGSGARLLVSRFVTPPLPGEATASVEPHAGGVEHGGEVVVVSPATMTVTSTLVLRHSDVPDASNRGRGVPNYLGAAAIAPDGHSAWVPSKQDNVARGRARDGQDLDFQNTVRAISSRLDLDAMAEDATARVDHDNASKAVLAAFHPTGAYLFVALETSRQVAVVDPVGHAELFRIEVGRAPQGLVVAPDGLRLFVENFMDRTVSVVDLAPLVTTGEFRAPVVATLASVTAERLAPEVLRGKQLFYDARDPRLARDAYLSCAACHDDGDEDGRVWDLTGFGEGLRNTIRLRGRAGGQGLLHWSANFDEVQDFETQLRRLAGGTGLVDDALLAVGTRAEPLGDAKAGLSPDLDALAAYEASLAEVTPNPGVDAEEGRKAFGRSGCPECHNGSSFSDEARRRLRDVGTIRPTSGSRLGGPLVGIDVPTLLDAWATPPYLHDGSAPTLAAAVLAHQGVVVHGGTLAQLVAFLQQLDAGEPGFAPPRLVECAREHGLCHVPAGRTVTVYFGARDRYLSRTGVSGVVACEASAFGGDPVRGVRKTCGYAPPM
jgi:YVTN family beta-propeller protein